MKASLLKSISLVAFLALATPAHAADDPVVAIVDGQKITYSQVMTTKTSLPKQYQSKSDKELFPLLLNQAVDTLLIDKAAKASGIDQQPNVQKDIAKATETIVAQAYLLSKVKDIISDASVQAKYNEVIKNFPKENEIHLRHILLDNKETALSVIKALKGGADFKTLAKAKSKDGTAKEGGDLGFFRKSELPQELADAAFALKAGTYSQEPVKTDFGWHVLKVDAIREAKPPKFEEIKIELKSLMTQEAVVALVKDLRSKSKIELFDKDGKPLPLEPEKKPKAEASEQQAPAATAPTEASKEAPAPTSAK